MESNGSILSKYFYQNGTSNLDQLVPGTDISNLAKVFTEQFTRGFAGNMLASSAFTGLIDVITNQVYRQKLLKNPLAQFKKGFSTGGSIEEIVESPITPRYRGAKLSREIDNLPPGTDPLEKKHRDPFRNDRLDIDPPVFDSSIYKSSRDEKYHATMTVSEFSNALLGGLESNALNEMIARKADILQSQDNLDEFFMMRHLIKLADDKYIPNWKDTKTPGNSIYRVAVPNVTNRAAYADPGVRVNDVQGIMEEIGLQSSYMHQVEYINRYTHTSVPLPLTPDEKPVLFATPALVNAFKFSARANTFNQEQLNYDAATFEIPNLPIDGCLAILTTPDFFACWDIIDTFATEYNPSALSWELWLHRKSIHAASRFAPIVAFVAE